MENENLKIFKVSGEYKMSEDDTFKSAKNISLESALKILDGEVKNFLRDNFKSISDDDIPKIIEKFLQKNEPHFVRENLPENEMICYAYIDAEINLDDLKNFLKNFDVFKLEKKVAELEKKLDDLQKIVDEHDKKFKEDERLTDNDYKYHHDKGLDYFFSKNYEVAIINFTEAIKLNPDFSKAYYFRGRCYEEIRENEKARADFEKARELDN